MEREDIPSANSIDMSQIKTDGNVSTSRAPIEYNESSDRFMKSAKMTPHRETAVGFMKIGIGDLILKDSWKSGYVQ